MMILSVLLLYIVVVCLLSLRQHLLGTTMVQHYLHYKLSRCIVLSKVKSLS